LLGEKIANEAEVALFGEVCRLAEVIAVGAGYPIDSGSAQSNSRNKEWDVEHKHRMIQSSIELCIPFTHLTENEKQKRLSETVPGRAGAPKCSDCSNCIIGR
jgi:hypothetical protein